MDRSAAIQYVGDTNNTEPEYLYLTTFNVLSSDKQMFQNYQLNIDVVGSSVFTHALVSHGALSL